MGCLVSPPNETPSSIWASKLDSYFSKSRKESSPNRKILLRHLRVPFFLCTFRPFDIAPLHFGSCYSPIHLDTLLRITTISYGSINLRVLCTFRSIYYSILKTPNVTIRLNVESRIIVNARERLYFTLYQSTVPIMLI